MFNFAFESLLKMQSETLRFEGIGFGQEQMVNDILLSLLLFMAVFFALFFRREYGQIGLLKEDFKSKKTRKNMFSSFGGNPIFVRSFMIFQGLFLSSLIFVKYILNRQVNPVSLDVHFFIFFSLIFVDLALFLIFKFGMYALLGKLFFDRENFSFLRSKYFALFSFWSISLYLPAIAAVVIGDVTISIYIFIILYILSRLVIVYKTLRLFSLRIDGIFYLILYLCALEILPLFVFYRLGYIVDKLIDF